MKHLLLLSGLTAATLQLPAQDLPKKLDSLLTAYSAVNEFNGTVMVYKKGKVLLHKAYGLKDKAQHQPNDTNTVFRVASVTKPFTSTLILQMAEQKKLSLDDKLSKYYPGFPHADSITIEMLLKHTSGYFNYTNDHEFMDNEVDKPATEEKILALFRNKPLDFSPGKGWNYSNSGYHLLGCIVEKVTGKSYYDVMQETIFKPLHMSRSSFHFNAIGYNAEGEPTRIVDSTVCYSAGAICSTTGDLLKFHQAMQKDQLISAASQQLAFTKLTNRYGYGWETDSVFGHRIVSHSGGIHGFRSNFARVTEDDICVVLLNNQERGSMSKINKKIMAVLYEQPYKLPDATKPLTLSEDVLKRYVGKYKMQVNQLELNVKLENGRLVVYPGGNAPTALLALGDNYFCLETERDFVVRFDADGTMLVDNGSGMVTKAPRI